MRVCSSAWRYTTRNGTSVSARSSMTPARADRYSPPRESHTTAARSTLEPGWRNSSASERIISAGRLSTQKYPESSKTAIADDFPAPERPEMTTRSSRWEREPSWLICNVAEGERRRRSSLAWQAKPFSFESPGTLTTGLVEMGVESPRDLLREAGD